MPQQSAILSRFTTTNKPNLICLTLTLTSATALLPALALSTPAPASKGFTGPSQYLNGLALSYSRVRRVLN
ncbi:hypothetical protein BDN67DRAFT_1014876 [Paxillus ammoniavirescens]|nr:hypothetical protein BDN67DRAFT_1014876 [Paxillus ammoniavirescens]